MRQSMFFTVNSNLRNIKQFTSYPNVIVRKPATKHKTSIRFYQSKQVLEQFDLFLLISPQTYDKEANLQTYLQ